MTKRAIFVTALVAALIAPRAAGAASLEAGAGRADITPPAGYPLLGWARGDARGQGQHTRLFARALVLRSGKHKVALVALDVNSIPGGMVQQAAALAGFDEREVLVEATHTHAGPTGFSNFLFKDGASPTVDHPHSGVTDPDPLLYTLMVEQTALAIRRADADRGPAVAGWGATKLEGLTRNRSLEAHLANHGVHVPRGEGNTGEDPGGYPHTIDPSVDVLRVDKVVRGKRVPIGAWSDFPNHGTVNKSTFQLYNADHHGAADRVFEAAVRRHGRVPEGQEVVNVYPNGAAGDVSAGLDHTGPAGAEEVGRSEAAAMLRAWRAAGRVLDGSPALDSRWTRVCFCGQATPIGPLDDHGVFGRAYLTGSEEGRGPLFDLTGSIYEGHPLASPGSAAQGVKDPVRSDDAHTLEPTGVPLSAVRIGDRVLLAVPGEMTSELGRRTKDAALAALGGSGVKRAVIAGYANEYASYVTTPEEYDAQHYEGGVTVYGRASGQFVQDALADLAGRLGRGAPAPAPYPFDPTRGLKPGGGSYPPGASRAVAAKQPVAVGRLGRATFAWTGGAHGIDRPLDRAFVTVERRVAKRWRAVDDDLGLRIAWRVGDPQYDGGPKFPAAARGGYSAEWEAPLDAPAGSYRFRVTANRYLLTSRPFALRPARTLTVKLGPTADGSIRLRLAYPAPKENVDLTARPEFASTGTVVATVDGTKKTLELRGGSVVVKANELRVAAGAGRDVHGNVNGRAAAANISSPPRTAD